MKFLGAVIVYLLMGAALGWGVLQAVVGKPIPLIVLFGAYAIVFAAIGCLSAHS